GACSMFRDVRENIAGGLARQQAALQRPAVACFDDGAVAQNQRQRSRQRFEDRSCEVVATSRCQRHLDAGVNRAGDSLAVCRRDSSVRIEKRAVNIEREETDHGKGTRDKEGILYSGSLTSFPPMASAFCLDFSLVPFPFSLFPC